jgi:TfoX/Sxy family transcriptional regulator of competence genes
MEKPTAEALALFDAAFPEDARTERKKMFGMPAAFVNGNMFYGVFHNGVCMRVGEGRRDEIASNHEGVEAFEPMPGRPWKEYIHVDAGAFGSDADELGGWIHEALELTAAMPAKKKKKKASKKGK